MTRRHRSRTRRRHVEISNRRPTNKQLIALWNMRIREMCNTMGRLYGLQRSLYERTGTFPWLPQLPDTEDLRGATSGHWNPEPEQQVRAAGE